MEAQTQSTRSTLREIAHSLDCLIADEVQTLTGWTSGTLEAYRKRGKGPSFIKTGKHFLYPRSGITAFMADNTRERSVIGKAAL